MLIESLIPLKYTEFIEFEICDVSLIMRVFIRI